MFNQTLLWISFIFPWFLLLFFHKQKVKRFMATGFLCALIMTIIFQLGERLHWWTVKETVFPLTHLTPMIYSFYVVAPIIVLYFTFGNFWLYMLVNAVMDIIYAVGLMKWYEYLGIMEYHNINGFSRFLILQAVAILIYWFQKWHDSSSLSGSPYA
ncbi:hypothetical protein [Anoxybacteroides rupiense]|uniref:hypothetical protein n=1 Tax=Anoxybacteroides rupiense TaxID=311460 RepID=UPI001BAAC844|nr:hypothetical protein [Anoxybacillus rupiensis]MBS2772517.1 hypothetical protein [Anoxybacillus rupiensis]